MKFFSEKRIWTENCASEKRKIFSWLNEFSISSLSFFFLIFQILVDFIRCNEIEIKRIKLSTTKIERNIFFIVQKEKKNNAGFELF